MKRIRVVLCGEASVGKSSIINRFATGTFNETMSETVGGAFHSAPVRFNKETLWMEIWDTAGSERYHSIIPSFFKNTTAVVIVYDTTCNESFSTIGFWVDFARESSPEDVHVFLVGNKVDLFEGRAVLFEDGESASVENRLAGFTETSAKTGEGIDNLFSLLAGLPCSATVEGQPIENVISLDKGSCC
jgi:small GTP-binding protein